MVKCKCGKELSQSSFCQNLKSPPLGFHFNPVAQAEIEKRNKNEHLKKGVQTFIRSHPFAPASLHPFGNPCFGRYLANYLSRFDIQ
jgi:hypothetical protein